MDRSTHPIDVENFRLDAATVRLGKGQYSPDEVASVRYLPEKERKRRERGHIKVPLTWHYQLKGADGPTLHTAQHICYLHWKGKGGSVKLANGALAEIGVSRKGKYRALRELESRGLITVERPSRRSPIVTVIDHVPDTA
jgi:hypothetical protein